MQHSQVIIFYVSKILEIHDVKHCYELYMCKAVERVKCALP